MSILLGVIVCGGVGVEIYRVFGYPAMMVIMAVLTVYLINSDKGAST